MNETLPPLPIWQARSFIAAVLLLVIFVAKMFGVDLPAWFASHGFGSTPVQVTESILALIPPLLVIWMYLERLAPKYRLVFRRIIR